MMEECPQCGQVPGEKDEECPHCGFPFDPKAQAEYRSPQMQKIEQEILTQVIARVESYWEAQQAKDEKDQINEGRGERSINAAGTKAGGTGWLCGLLRGLAWIQLLLGLIGAYVLWDAAGQQGPASNGNIALLAMVLSVFCGLAGWALLLAAGKILETVSGR